MTYKIFYSCKRTEKTFKGRTLKFHSFFIIFSVYGKEIRITFAIFRMRLGKSARQVLRLYRPSFNDEKDFQTQQPAGAVRKIQALAILGDDWRLQTAKRSRTEREGKKEKERRKKNTIRASQITLISSQSVSRKKVETRLRTVVLNNGENDADCGTPSNTARGSGNGNVSKQNHQESSWHHLCELLCETISRDSRCCRCESRSTVTILVRSGRYNVAGQCLPIQTSVSDVAIR